MILRFVMKLAFGFIKLILRIIYSLGLVPAIFPVMSSSFLNNFMEKFQFLVEKASVLFFLFIRPSTFSNVIDVLFWLHAFIPAVYLVFFVLKKIPFLNIE